MFHTPPTSPRQQEIKRLKAEANGGLLAPTRAGSHFHEGRERLIEGYVNNGLNNNTNFFPAAAPAAAPAADADVNTSSFAKLSLY
jgi:hypothetical protein